MSDIHADRILILDFGSQYTQLIARRVREAGIYCEIHPNDMAVDALTSFSASGVILSGGPETVLGDDTLRAPDEVFGLGVPVLGICYGMQTMAAQLGGEVEASAKREFGYAQVRARGHSALLKDIEDHTSDEGYGLLDVWMSHGDRISALPDGFTVIASTDSAPLAGMANESHRFYALQFHPEESTPPDRPNKTLPSPTCLPILAMLSSIILPGDQRLPQPQISCTNRSRIR